MRAARASRRRREDGFSLLPFRQLERGRRHHVRRRLDARVDVVPDRIEALDILERLHRRFRDRRQEETRIAAFAPAVRNLEDIGRHVGRNAGDRSELVPALGGVAGEVGPAVLNAVGDGQHQRRLLRPERQRDLAVGGDRTRRERDRLGIEHRNDLLLRVSATRPLARARLQPRRLGRRRPRHRPLAHVMSERGDRLVLHAAVGARSAPPAGVGDPSRLGAGRRRAGTFRPHVRVSVRRLEQDVADRLDLLVGDAAVFHELDDARGQVRLVRRLADAIGAKPVKALPDVLRRLVRIPEHRTLVVLVDVVAAEAENAAEQQREEARAVLAVYAVEADRIVRAVREKADRGADVVQALLALLAAVREVVVRPLRKTREVLVADARPERGGRDLRLGRVAQVDLRLDADEVAPERPVRRVDERLRAVLVLLVEFRRADDQVLPHAAPVQPPEAADVAHSVRRRVVPVVIVVSLAEGLVQAGPSEGVEEARHVLLGCEGRRGGRPAVRIGHGPGVACGDFEVVDGERARRQAPPFKEGRTVGADDLERERRGAVLPGERGLERLVGARAAHEPAVAVLLGFARVLDAVLPEVKRNARVGRLRVVPLVGARLGHAAALGRQRRPVGRQPVRRRRVRRGVCAHDGGDTRGDLLHARRRRMPRREIGSRKPRVVQVDDPRAGGGSGGAQLVAVGREDARRVVRVETRQDDDDLRGRIDRAQFLHQPLCRPLELLFGHLAPRIVRAAEDENHVGIAEQLRAVGLRGAVAERTDERTPVDGDADGRTNVHRDARPADGAVLLKRAAEVRKGETVPRLALLLHRLRIAGIEGVVLERLGRAGVLRIARNALERRIAVADDRHLLARPWRRGGEKAADKAYHGNRSDDH